VKPPEDEAFLAFWTSNECNKFAPFAVFLVCSRFKQQAIEKPIGEYKLTLAYTEAARRTVNTKFAKLR